MIVLDDFGYNDLAVNNGSDSPTPTLDQLAREGIRFTRHYAESSCTPSRVALLTGQFPARHGFAPVGAGLSRDVVTLPEVLAGQGYTTHLIGKWHAGDAHPLSRPEHHGFATWFGFTSQLYLAGPHGPEGYRRGRPTYRDPWLENQAGELRQYPGHLTELLTGSAMAFIRQQTTPWFLYLSYFAPHTPLQPSTEYAGGYPDSAAGRYQALKAQLDSSIGRVLETLRETEKLQNTLLVVVSDNGGTGASWPSNAPFAGAKTSYGEGGIRTPLILSWPDHWAGGEVREDAVAIIDLFPTITAALGIPAPPALDGQDLFGDRAPRKLRWFSHGLLGDAYSVLSDDGAWRLNAIRGWTGEEVGLYRQSDLDRGDSRPDTEADSSLLRHLDESMTAWVAEATTVGDLSTTDTGDWREYRGSAFRRTPMLGTHTIGIALQYDDGDSMTAEPRTILEQEGYLDFRLEGRQLQISVDGYRTAIPLRAEGNCASVVVSSQLTKNNQVYLTPDSRSIVRVYLNGKQVHQGDFRHLELNPHSPENPLRIRTGAKGGWHMSPAAAPYISTRFLDAREISERVHPLLSAACAHSPGAGA